MRELLYQAIRKSDYQVVSWYAEEDTGYPLPELTSTNRYYGDIAFKEIRRPLDRSIQWNEQDFWARVYPQNLNPPPPRTVS